MAAKAAAKAAKAAAPAPAPPSSAEDLFAAGQRVELAGLQSSADLNGQRGKVVSWAAEKQRYEIALASGAQLRVKPPNLRRVPHDDADVALDEDQPHGPQWAGHGTKDQLAELIQSHDASFRTRRPLLRDSGHLVQMMEAGLETTLRTDFCWSLNFTPRFLAHLCHEGFLPICSDLSGDAGLYTLMPKWHVERCCMRFADLHISKSARKRAKKFRLTVDRCFDVVVDRCVVRRPHPAMLLVAAGQKRCACCAQEQHGENWLYPPMRRAFRALYNWGREQPHPGQTAPEDAAQLDGDGGEGAAAAAAAAGGGGGAGGGAAAWLPHAQAVRFHSFELWSGSHLCAGEFGAVVGGTRGQPTRTPPHSQAQAARCVVQACTHPSLASSTRITPARGRCSCWRWRGCYRRRGLPSGTWGRSWHTSSTSGAALSHPPHRPARLLQPTDGLYGSAQGEAAATSRVPCGVSGGARRVGGQRRAAAYAPAGDRPDRGAHVTSGRGTVAGCTSASS